MPQTLPDNVVDLRSAPTLRVLAGGGEPPHDGGMEARVAVVENEVKHVRDAIADVRADVGAIIPALTKFKDDVNAEFKELRREARAETWKLLGALAGGFLALLAAMAAGFGWF